MNRKTLPSSFLEDDCYINIAFISAETQRPPRGIVLLFYQLVRHRGIEPRTLEVEALCSIRLS